MKNDQTITVRSPYYYTNGGIVPTANVKISPEWQAITNAWNGSILELSIFATANKKIEFFEQKFNCLVPDKKSVTPWKTVIFYSKEDYFKFILEWS